MGVKSETQLNCKMSWVYRREIEESAEKLGLPVSYLLREGAVRLGNTLLKQKNLHQEE